MNRVTQAKLKILLVWLLYYIPIQIIVIFLLLHIKQYNLMTQLAVCISFFIIVMIGSIYMKDVLDKKIDKARSLERELRRIGFD